MKRSFDMPLHAISKFLSLILFVYLSLTITVTSATAANYGRPLTAEGPTEVSISVFVLDVDEVSSAGQNFDANIYIELRWKDPRLAHDNPHEISLDLKEVWNPRIHFINQQKIWLTFPEIVEVLPDGEVVYRQRVWGSFSQPLALRDFPFDRQVFNIQLGSVGYGPEEVKLISPQGSRTGIAERFSLADWDILDWTVNIASFAPSQKDDTFSGYTLSIEAKRRYGYFIIKVIIPLFLIVMMSWVVFWIDPKQVSNQLSVAVTTVLTLIAYHIALSGRLPQIPYLTQMDKFLFSSTILVFMSLIEVVITSHLSSTDRLALARRIDLTARWFFPVLFALSFGISFVM